MSERPEEWGSTPADPAPRLPYERPRLGRVRLQAEQILATGCKSGNLGPNSGQDSPCNLGPCGQIQGERS